MVKFAKWEWGVLAVAMAVGAALRVAFLLQVPGLWYDEAINGLDALRILQEPGWPIFFDTFGHMREPMYMYLEAIGVRIGGPTALAIRAVSTAIGILTIPVVWLLAREWRGARFAAVAVCVFASMRWHVHFSGLAFRTILAPLFASLTFLFFLRSIRRNAMGDAVACGVCLGLGAYTYLAFRLVPLALAIPMVFHFVGAGSRRGAVGRLYGALVLAAGVTFAPLGWDYLRNPDHFSGRGSEVSLSDHGNPALLMAKQARDVALMPLLRGDHVGKHNIPGPPRFFQMFSPAENPPLDTTLRRWEENPGMDPHGTGVPAFPPLTGILFYVGLFMILKDCRRDAGSVALVSWLLVGSLASILSFGAPNMLRMLMVTPVAAMAIAVGGIVVFERLAGKSSRAAITVVCFVGLLHLGTEAWRLWQWPTHSMVPKEFNAELAQIGEFLAVQPDNLAVRLPFDEQPTLSFLAAENRYNPPEADLGDRWWEFRFSGLIPLGRPVDGGRRLEVMHPIYGYMGDLVEVER